MSEAKEECPYTFAVGGTMYASLKEAQEASEQSWNYANIIVGIKGTKFIHQELVWSELYNYWRDTIDHYESESDDDEPADVAFNAQYKGLVLELSKK